MFGQPRWFLCTFISFMPYGFIAVYRRQRTGVSESFKGPINRFAKPSRSLLCNLLLEINPRRTPSNSRKRTVNGWKWLQDSVVFSVIFACVYYTRNVINVISIGRQISELMFFLLPAILYCVLNSVCLLMANKMDDDDVHPPRAELQAQISHVFSDYVACRLDYMLFVPLCSIMTCSCRSRTLHHMFHHNPPL